MNIILMANATFYIWMGECLNHKKNFYENTEIACDDIINGCSINWMLSARTHKIRSAG